MSNVCRNMNRKGIMLSIGLSVASVAVAVIGVMLWMMASCDFQDDHYFRHVVPLVHDDHALNFSEFEKFESRKVCDVDDVAESIINHYMIFNSRMADKFLIISNLFPEWLVDVFHALAYALMLVSFLTLVSNDWWKSPLLTVSVIVLTWLVLPWSRVYSSNAYFFNYVWSAAINLLLISLLMIRISSKAAVLSLSVLALIASMMHEGFALPIALGFLIETLIERKKRTVESVLLKVCYCAGCLAFVVSPGLWHRLENPWDSAMWSDYLYAYTIGSIPMWLLLLSVIIKTSRLGREWLKKWSVDNAFYLMVIIVSMSLSVVTSTFDRAWWMAYMFAMLLIIKQISDLKWYRNLLGISYAKGVAWAVITMLLMLFFYKIVVTQKCMTEQAERCAEILETSESNFICESVDERGNLPIYMMNIPIGVKEDYPFKEKCRLHKGGEPVIYPSCYLETPFDKLPKVEGRNNLRGLYPWYYSPSRLTKEQRVFNVTFGDPDEGETDGNISLFFSLRRWFNKLNGRSGRLERVYELQEIPVIVSQEMRENGICNSDTAWFYKFEKNQKSLKGCRVIKMDSVKSK